MTKTRNTRKEVMCKIVILVVTCFTCLSAHDAAFGFVANECVTRLIEGVDPQFRVSPAQAKKTCEAIALRITKLSKQAVGKWQFKVAKGKINMMVLSADGTAHVRCYNFVTNQMEDLVKKWAFENPYGTVGEECLELDGESMGSVKFSGTNTMIITSQPATATMVDRWKRVK